MTIVSNPLSGLRLRAGAALTFGQGRQSLPFCDGVMDAGVMEFTALPEDAARMLAALEYVHVVDVYDELAATDTVTVTATYGRASARTICPTIFPTHGS